MARGRNLVAFARGYLKGEIVKNEAAIKAKEDARKAEEAQAVAAAEFNSGIVKKIIGENPELLSNINMTYEEASTSQGVNKVINAIEALPKNDPLAKTWAAQSASLIAKYPKSFKGKDLSEIDLTDQRGYLSLLNFNLVDEDTTKKDDNYKTITGADENTELTWRHIHKISSKAHATTNMESILEQVRKNPSVLNDKTMSAEISSYLQAYGVKAIDLHASNVGGYQNLTVTPTTIEFDSMIKYAIGSGMESLVPVLKNLDNLLATKIAGSANHHGVAQKNMEGKFVKHVAVDTPKGTFKNLSGLLGFPDELAMFNKFSYAIGPSGGTEIFRLTEKILNIKGVAKGDGSTIFTDEGLVEANVEYSAAVNRVLEVSSLPTKNKIIALAIAQNKQMPERGIGTGSKLSFDTTVTQQILNMTGGTKTLGEAKAKLTQKIKEGKEVRNLALAYAQLIIPDGQSRDSGIDTGFAGGLENLILNVVGPTGQLEQLGSWFKGETTTAQQNAAYFNPKDMEKSGMNFIDKYIADHSGKSAEYGKAAALRIFLAYKMAKYFDPSGRVSDRDLQNQLDAFAGTALSGKLNVAGMLSIAVERINAQLELEQMHNFDPNNITAATVRRVSAAGSYFALQDPATTRRVKAMKSHKVVLGNGMDQIVAHKNDNNQMVMYNGKQVYKVHAADSNGEATYERFQDVGGLFVYKDDFGQLKNISSDRFESSALSAISSVPQGKGEVSEQPVIITKIRDGFMEYNRNTGETRYASTPEGFNNENKGN